jgi:2-hydroxy-3-keto-5-methylthiopentenyl-1-phosphate phosphatase
MVNDLYEEEISKVIGQRNELSKCYDDLKQKYDEILAALLTCDISGYRDIDGDWIETKWFDTKKVQNAINNSKIVG